MTENIIMKMGKNEVIPRILSEENSYYYDDFIQINIERNFHNFSMVKKEFPIKVVDRKISEKFIEVQNKFKDGLISGERRMGNYFQYQDGVMVFGVGKRNDNPNVYGTTSGGVYRGYSETLRQSDFYNDSYIHRPPLANLEASIVSAMNDNTEITPEFVYILIYGDGNDYYAGYRDFFNEENPTTTNKKIKKLMPEITNSSEFYLRVLEKYGTSLNVRKIERDSYKGRYDGNLPASRPIDYYLTYIGKLDVSKNKIVEEIYTFDKREVNVGKTRILTNPTLGTVNDLSTPSFPYNYDYTLSPLESSMMTDGWEIIYGINDDITYNISKTAIDEEAIVPSEKHAHHYSGIVYDLYEFACHKPVNSSGEKFSITLGTKVSEL